MASRGFLNLVRRHPTISALVVAMLACATMYAVEGAPARSARGADWDRSGLEVAALINENLCGVSPRAPSGSEIVSPVAGGADTGPGGAEAAGPVATALGFWSNYGNYMPRTMCLATASGSPDWPWITTLLVLSAGVVISYLIIYVFWMKCYLAERREDRNRKLFEMAQVFLWCAVCGYVMSMLIFVWPAYRLLAVFLFLLNVWSWRFVLTRREMAISFQANRLDRELHESLERRQAELEALVDQRTTELAEARRVADDANAAKSKFLANMSHEIRTPMTAILGYTDALRDSGALPAEHHAHLDTIRRNGAHLLTVLNDILDLSKIESGRMSIEPLPVDLHQTFGDIEQLMRRRAEDKGLEFHVGLSDNVPRTARTDPTRLRQILLNLVGNAIKFTERGAVRVAADADGEELLVEVGDTGIGMAPEQAARLFTPFIQGDASTTRRFGGTGLGLSVSHGLASLLGGSISVESAEGVGSVFRLRIHAPAVEGDAVPPDTNSPDPTWRLREGLRVLVVDDGADNRRLIGYHLAGAGVAYDFAFNGKEALDRLLAPGAPVYDLVFLDMMMPLLDGYGVAHELRGRGWEIPIVALTANAMRGDAARCLESGCTDYLSKPFKRSDLLSMLAKHTSPDAGQRVA